VAGEEDPRQCPVDEEAHLREMDGSKAVEDRIDEEAREEGRGDDDPLFTM
jgi:hypothetical protein